MRLRGALAMPAAALAVHQLRYVLAYGDGAGGELAGQGHAYLHSVTPWIALGMCVAVGSFLGRAAHAWRTGRGATGASLALLKLWLAASAALLAIYAGQELLEGCLASGHATGLAGAFGAGGFWAVPAALWIGGLVALALRGAQVVLARLGRRGVSRARRGAVPRPLAPPVVFARPVAPLATAAAGRAPPGGCG
jgi:hypothetical protein